MPKRYTPVTAAADLEKSAAPSRRAVEAGDLVPPVRGKDHAISPTWNEPYQPSRKRCLGSS